MISALPWILMAGMAAPTWAPTPSGRPRLRLGTLPLRCHRADPDKKRRRKAQQHARRQQRGRR